MPSLMTAPFILLNSIDSRHSLSLTVRLHSEPSVCLQSTTLNPISPPLNQPLNRLAVRPPISKCLSHSSIPSNACFASSLSLSVTVSVQPIVLKSERHGFVCIDANRGFEWLLCSSMLWGVWMCNIIEWTLHYILRVLFVKRVTYLLHFSVHIRP